MPRKINKKDLKDYLKDNGGDLVMLTDGNYNIRKDGRSRNIGRPDSGGRWSAYQLTRAWGQACGIPKPRWL